MSTRISPSTERQFHQTSEMQTPDGKKHVGPSAGSVLKPTFVLEDQKSRVSLLIKEWGPLFFKSLQLYERVIHERAASFILKAFQGDVEKAKSRDELIICLFVYRGLLAETKPFFSQGSQKELSNANVLISDIYKEIAPPDENASSEPLVKKRGEIVTLLDKWTPNFSKSLHFWEKPVHGKIAILIIEQFKENIPSFGNPKNLEIALRIYQGLLASTRCFFSSTASRSLAEADALITQQRTSLKKTMDRECAKSDLACKG